MTISIEKQQLELDVRSDGPALLHGFVFKMIDLPHKALLIDIQKIKFQ